MLYQQI